MSEPCAVCGAAVDAGDRFCGECGHRVDSSAAPAPDTLTLERPVDTDELHPGWSPRAGSAPSPAETTVARTRPALLPDVGAQAARSPAISRGAWIAVAVSVCVFVAAIVTIVVVLLANEDNSPAAESSNAQSQDPPAADEEPVGDARLDLGGGTSSDLGGSTTAAPNTVPPTTAAAWRSWISLETHPSTIRMYPCRQMLAHGVPYDFVVDYFQKWNWFYLQEGGGGMDQDSNGKPCEGQYPSESAQYDPARDYMEAP